MIYQYEKPNTLASVAAGKHADKVYGATSGEITTDDVADAFLAGVQWMNAHGRETLDLPADCYGKAVAR